MHYVYLIESVSTAGRRYKGFSENLRQRLTDHNAGKLATTAPHRPWRLVTYLAFSSKRQALDWGRFSRNCFPCDLRLGWIRKHAVGNPHCSRAVFSGRVPASCAVT